jgi:hypothetical protein
MVHKTDVAAYQRRPGNVLAAVEIELRDRGLTRLYVRACPLIGVISVASGVTAWCDGRTLRWRYGDQETMWPVVDAVRAAEQLAELAKHAEARS